MSFDFTYYWHKIQQDDVKALEKLFTETHQQLCFYAYHITKDPYTAEEIVQDVFFKIWQKRKEITLKGSLRAYLFQSTHNLAISSFIHDRTLKQSISKPVTSELWQFLENTSDMNAFLLETLEAEETEEIIEKTIRNLPEQCREVFILSRFEKKSNKEIASLHHISENTVKTQIYRALEKIKEALDKNR